MPHTPRRRWALALLVAVVALGGRIEARPGARGPWSLAVSLLPRGAFAAGEGASHGELEGQELPIANELQSGFESVAGSILGGAISGEVTRVVVATDEPQRLVVRVTYTGFQGARLWGEILVSNRNRLPGVVTPDPVTLADAGGEVELAFEAAPEARGAATAPSTRLRINVAQAGRSTPSYRRSFQLAKSWSPPLPTGADFSVTITPQPIGRTVELGPTPSLVVPSTTIRTPDPQPPSGKPPAPSPTAAAPMTATRRIAAPIRTDAAVSGTRAIASGGTAPAPAGGQAAARALPPMKGIVAARDFKGGLTPEEKSHGARGPGAMPLRPFGDVRTEDIRLDLTRVLNLFPEVYQDQEPTSGVFYFLPHSYALEWDESEGYEFRTVYSAATGGAAGQVLMAARLDAGIAARDLEIASRLVQAYAAAHGLPFRELRAMPIDTIGVSLSDDLGRFSIPGDRVSVHGISDVMGQLDVSWVTDERTKDFIQEALIENVGINGSVTYAPTGGTLGARQVPIRMLLADYATFGPFRWDRTGWRNATPYPITLRYLHALRTASGQPAVVNSWSLGDTRVPPGGQVRWSATRIPFWLDTQADKMWLDYVVDRSCTACGAQAIVALTGGVSSAGAAQITFHTLTPLADAGAHEITVEVRSRLFDPRGAATQVRSVVLDADEKDFTLGPIFPGDRGTDGRDPSRPLFEYRLGLTMKDGRDVRGNAAWLRGDDLRVPIGRFQLESSIGALPGR